MFKMYVFARVVFSFNLFYFSPSHRAKVKTADAEGEKCLSGHEVFTSCSDCWRCFAMVGWIWKGLSTIGQLFDCLIGYSELLYKWLTSQSSLMHFSKKEYFEVQSSRIGRKEIPIELEHSCRCTLIGGVHLYVKAILFRTFFPLGLMSLF